MPCLMLQPPPGSAFAPSGMNKSGTQSIPGAWVQVTGWVADTATYPGSSVASNALLAQGAKVGATVSSSLAWSQGTFGNTVGTRLKQNGSVIATSLGTGSTTSPTAVSVSGITLVLGDLITLEVQDTGGYGGTYPATITAGTTSWVQIS